MTRAHKRTDFQYIIVRGQPAFSRVAYACVITQATAYDDERSIYHIELFFGRDGRSVRGEAMRYGSDICHGRFGVAGFRRTDMPHNFPSAGLPKPEQDVEVR